MTDKLKITALEVENVKRVRTVAMTIEGNALTVIGGNNGQGKTSILDAITWTLGGDRFRPSNPVRDGAEKEGQYAGYRKGVLFINPWSKARPGVVDAQRNEIMDLTTVYAGMYARASVRPFAYDSGSNKGVGLLLEAVQFVKDGERLDGRKSARDMFSAYEEV